MLYKTIKLKSCNECDLILFQFMLLDPSRREAFWKTLNDDANALVREIGESSPEMRKLREELANCNQIFLSLSASAMEHGKEFFRFEVLFF